MPDTNLLTPIFGTGQETHRIPAKKITEKSGKSSGILKVGPKTGPIRIEIYVEDSKGNKSNKLSKTTQRI